MHLSNASATIVATIMLQILIVSADLTNAQDAVLESAVAVIEMPNGDNKDDDTGVSIEVKALKGNDATTIAQKLNFGKGDEYDDPSTHEIALDVTNKIKKNEINRLRTIITEHPDGNDRWLFNLRVTLNFSDGSTVVQNIPGVILDQDCHTRSTNKWIKPQGIDLDLKLRAVELVIEMPKGDNKDGDTRLSAELKCQLNEEFNILVADKIDFAGDQEFNDPGTYKFNLDLKTPIKLSQLVNSKFTLTQSPNGNDRWIFNARLNLDFDGTILTKEADGVILDQQFRSLVLE